MSLHNRQRLGWLGLLPLLAVMGIVLLAASPAAQARTLRIGISQFPSTLHPLIDSMLAKSYVLGLARRPLTSYDENWELACLVCTEVPTLENGLAVRETTASGEEGIAVTYEIVEGAAWGDGTPVTSEDVVFTWQVGRNPQSGVASLEGFRRILDVEVLSARRFVLHVDRVTFDYNAANGLELLPAHIERPLFEANPAEYRNRTAYDSDSTNPGLYFGPYRISEVVKGSHVVLVLNETWWGEKPAFERIIVRTIENTAALEANLLSGEIDMIAGELGLTIDQGLAFAERHGDTFQVFFKPGLIYEHIDLMLENPILADRKVRKALILSADRQAISEQLFQGRQPVALTNVSPLDWVFSDQVARYPYDPKAAAALLDEAGWDRMQGGVRHNAKGEPLRLELMTTAGDRTRELVEQVLQAGWRQVGIDLRIRNEPARVFFGETVSKRKFTGLALFAWLSAPESVPRTTLHSEEVPSETNNWSGQNYTGYNNPEVDQLLDAIERELDRERRADLWLKLQQIYAEDLPVLPLYWRAATYVLPKEMQGVVPTGHLSPTTYWVENWQWND
ncbi:peptide ABC transporter substrate-binding protein [Limibacillus sp. MBR-115]|uniref:peptide ABC transporter substrate-binding protein n=1 Tax=Limibacillus sp. MBR-115 TaxID=3156465 RepID=UPI00339933E0